MKMKDLFKKPLLYIIISSLLIAGLVIGLCVAFIPRSKKSNVSNNGTDGFTEEQIKFFKDLEINSSFDKSGELVEIDKNILLDSETISEVFYLSDDYMVVRVKKTEGDIVPVVTESIEVMKKTIDGTQRVIGGVSLIGSEYDVIYVTGDYAIISQRVKMIDGSAVVYYGIMNLQNKSLIVDFGKYDISYFVNDLVALGYSQEDSCTFDVYYNGVHTKSYSNVVLEMELENVLNLYSKDQFYMIGSKNGQFCELLNIQLQAQPCAENEAVFNELDSYYNFITFPMVKYLSENLYFVQNLSGDYTNMQNISNYSYFFNAESGEKLRQEYTSYYLDVNLLSNGYICLAYANVNEDVANNNVYLNNEFKEIWNYSGYGYLDFTFGDLFIFKKGDVYDIANSKLEIFASSNVRPEIGNDYLWTDSGVFDKHGNTVDFDEYNFVSNSFGDYRLASILTVYEDRSERQWFLINKAGEKKEIENVASEFEGAMLLNVGFYVVNSDGGFILFDLEKDESHEFQELNYSIKGNKLYLFGKTNEVESIKVFNLLTGNNIIRTNYNNAALIQAKDDTIELMSTAGKESNSFQESNVYVYYSGSNHFNWDLDKRSGAEKKSVTHNGLTFTGAVTFESFSSVALSLSIWFGAVQIDGYKITKYIVKGRDIAGNERILKEESVLNDNIKIETGYTGARLQSVWVDVYVQPITYEVMYFSEYGEIELTGTIVYHSRYTNLDLSSPAGELLYWVCVYPYDEELSVASIKNNDICLFPAVQILFAVWDTSRTIYFMNGQEQVSAKTLSYNDKYEFPSVTKQGYTFDGWWTEATGGREITKDDKVTFAGKEQTLYAHWKPNTYDFIFNMNEKGLKKWDSDSNQFNTYNMSSYYEDEDANGSFVNGGLITIGGASPTLPGYEFLGWYTEQTNGVKVEDGVSGLLDNKAGSVTLYAHWSPISDKKFDVYENSELIDLDQKNNVEWGVKTSVEIDKHDVLSKDSTYHYLFFSIVHEEGTDYFESSNSDIFQLSIDGVGFFSITKQDSKYKIEVSALQKNVVIHYNHIEVDLIYDNGTGENGEISVIKGKKYGEFGELPSPVKKGYTFDGWYTAATGGTKIDETILVTTSEDHSLYAHWRANEYEVNFYSACGTKFNPITVAFGEEYSNLPKEPVRVGYTFKGWYPSEEITEESTKITENTKVTTAGEHTLYAHWEANEYKVNFDSAGGELVDSKYVVFDGEYGELSTPNKNGYEFLGWYTAASGGTKIDENTSVKTAGEHTLYAHWQGIEFSFEFDVNGGQLQSGYNPIQVVTSVQVNFIFPKATSAGYNSFVWVNENLNLKFYAGEVENIRDELAKSVDFEGENIQITLTADWSEAQNVLITLNSNYESGETTSQDAIFGQPYINLPELERIGYTFDGWWTEATGGTKIDETTLVTTSEDHIIFAHWTPIKYSVQFNANGGSGSIYSQNFVFGTNAEIKAVFERNGYKFVGWSLGINEPVSESNLLDSFVKSNEQNIYLYAIWQANEVLVTLNANGGVLEDTTSKNVTFDANYGILPTPVRVGYTFKGWYTEYGALVSQYSIVKISNAHTLVAKWSLNSYIVEFDANGGSVEPQNRLYYFGDQYANLPTPVRVGYIFDGWYTEATGGNEVTADTTVEIAQNHTLYAHWIARSYIVNFNANGGNGEMQNQEFLFGESTRLYENSFENEGYMFVGWSQTSNGSVDLDDMEIVDTIVTQLTPQVFTLYAIWAPIEYTVILNNIDGNGGQKPFIVNYDEILEIDKSIFNYNNYILLGFATSQSGDEVYCVNQEKEELKNLVNTPDGIVNLWAVWAFEIEFDSAIKNGDFDEVIGDMPSQLVRLNQNNPINPNVFSRKFYVFENWSVSVGDYSLNIPNDEKNLEKLEKYEKLNIDTYGSVVFSANWIERQITIKFENNLSGVSEPAPDLIEPIVISISSENVKIDNLNNCLKVSLDELSNNNGWAFDGYFLNGVKLENNVLRIYDAPEGNQVLINVNWLKKYSVKMQFRYPFIDDSGIVYGQLVEKYLAGFDAQNRPIFSDEAAYVFDRKNSLTFNAEDFKSSFWGDDGLLLIGVKFEDVCYRLISVTSNLTGSTDISQTLVTFSFENENDVELVFNYVERVNVNFQLMEGEVIDDSIIGSNGLDIDKNASIGDELLRRYGRTIDKLPIATKTNLTFANWKTSDLDFVDVNTEFSNDAILIAHWKALVNYQIVDQNGQIIATELINDLVELGSLSSNLDNLLLKWNNNESLSSLQNEFYSGRDLLFNKFILNGKIYRFGGLKGIDDQDYFNGEINQNMILSIVLIERTFVTFEIDDDENSVVGIEDFSEYFNSILDELKEKNIEIALNTSGKLEIVYEQNKYKFVIEGDLGTSLSYYFNGPTRTGALFVGWENIRTLELWTKENPLNLSDNGLVLKAKYVELKNSIQFLYFDGDEDEYIAYSTMSFEELNFGSENSIELSYEDIKGDYVFKNITDESGTEYCPLKVIKFNNIVPNSEIMTDITTPGADFSIVISKEDFLNGNVYVYIVYSPLAE